MEKTLLSQFLGNENNKIASNSIVESILDIYNSFEDKSKVYQIISKVSYRHKLAMISIRTDDVILDFGKLILVQMWKNKELIHLPYPSTMKNIVKSIKEFEAYSKVFSAITEKNIEIILEDLYESLKI